MIPLIIAGITALLFVALFQDDPELSEIQTDDISDKLVKEIHADEPHLNLVKARATRIINSIVKQYDHFKIGKSGKPEKRIKQYDYTFMYLIFKSKNKTLINEMESFFNNKFIKHSKNDNKNRGSASVQNLKADGTLCML